MTETQPKKITAITFVFVVVWMAYALAYWLVKNNPLIANMSGLMPLIGLSFLDIIAIIYAITLYVKSNNPKSKKIFAFFALAFFFSLADDVTYNIAYNILHLQRSNVPFFVIIIDNLAFIGDLLFLAMVWLYVFSSFYKRSKYASVYNAVMWIIAASTAVISILTQWQSSSLLDNVFTVIEVFLCYIGFALAIFCLITSQVKAIFYTSLAFCISRVSDFIINYGVASQNYAIGSMLETSWVIGLLFVVYGLSLYKSEGQLHKDPHEWLITVND